MVCTDNVYSEAGTLKYGVPTGSTPFSIIVNDLPELLSDAGFYLCAGDTSIFYQHKDVKNIENILNKKFSSL